MVLPMKNTYSEKQYDCAYAAVVAEEMFSCGEFLEL
jgi:hypothetical protein